MGVSLGLYRGSSARSSWSLVKCATWLVKLSWATDPKLFLKNHLPQVVTRYKQLLEENDFDPQKVGKSHVAYDSVRDAFELALLRGNKN